MTEISKPLIRKLKAEIGWPACGGIDVGGTKISAGVVTERGEPREIGTQPTQARDGAANMATVRQFLSLLTDMGASRIGVSVATTIDHSGRVRDPLGYFGWTGMDLADELSDETHAVRVYHDAMSGATAEQRYGAATDSHDLLYVTVGSGLSHCFVCDGHAHAGALGMAYLSGYTSPARCGRNHCTARSVENIVSGHALADAYRPGSTDARAVCNAADAGDKRAAAIVEHAAWHLGAVIADLTTILDPDLVVLGGGLGYGAATYRNLAFESAESICKSRPRPGVRLRASRFGVMSCWLGAAILAYESEDTTNGTIGSNRLPVHVRPYEPRGQNSEAHRLRD